VNVTRSFLIGVAISASSLPALAQSRKLDVPKSVVAGSAFSIETEGGGQGVLYVVGPSQVLKRDVQLGQPVAIAAGDLDNAGHYLAVLNSGSSTETGEFDVVPANQPATLSFLAKPSRLPVGLQNGITGAVYVFDAFQNLITAPTPVSFQLSIPSESVQSRTVESHLGAAWTEMNSGAKDGNARFVARAGDVSATRVIEQVPGDPCGLRDCSGNAVTDGTIVTFTESWNGGQTTVDVPLKHGVAQAEVPAYNGARISVATGVVMGNEIRWTNQ